MFGIIFYNLKDSNSTTNIATNVVILNAMYILPNAVQMKSIAAKRISIATTEKNVVTIN